VTDRPSQLRPRHQRTGGHRRDPLWIAALVHRLSGLALACFLPLHFLALGLAIDGEARLDGFLKWTANPLVKLAETVLVLLLAVHMLGGIRVLVIENLPWRQGQKRLALLAGGAAIAAAALFLLRIVN
jgi:fumarate reductase subunit D